MPRFLRSVTGGQEVGQRTAKPVQLPDDQAVTGPDESERLGQAGAFTAAAAGMVLEQVALIHTGGQESIALKVQHLPITVAGDAHVADHHVRKTS